MDTNLYRAVGLVTSSLGPDQEVVLSELTGARAVLSPAEVDTLLRCSRFRSVEEHARDCGLASENVEAWVRSGLLLSRRALLELANRSETPATPPSKVATLGIVTRNRPESLERTLESFARNGRAYGRSHRLVVLDDSPEKEMRDRNRALAAKVRSATGALFSYGGLEEKAEFLRELGEKGGFPLELLHFAVLNSERCGYAVGSNRNAMLLDSAGELLVTADDDVICRQAALPEPSDGLRLTSNLDPTDFWFHPDRRSALDGATFAEQDFLGAHEELLGRSLSSCLAKAGENVDADAADGRYLRTIQSGQGRVLLTQVGYLGDSGMGSPSWLLSLAGASRERLLATEASYRSATHSRNHLRGVRRATLANASFFIAGAPGFDNRDLLPPFLPVQRNSDGVLSVTMRQSFLNGLIGHLPWALVHDPMDSRAYAADSVWKAGARLALPDVVISCLSMIDLGPAKPDGAERLRFLGTHLMELGSLPLRDFEWILRNVLWIRGGSSIDHLERLLEQHGSTPAYWAQDVRRAQDALRQALPREDYVVPVDLLEGRTPAEARELSKRVVFKFGQLLQAWPDIVAAAKDLRSRGVSLSKEL